MKRYFAIDGGTTNTRLYLIEDGMITDAKKLSVGIRANIETPGILQKEVREAIQMMTVQYGNPSAILASGMITCEHGLFNLPHILTPAGVKELHENMKEVLLPEISAVPFYFVPGVKQVSDDIALCDIMRGEECEIMGLSEGTSDDVLFVLPGSHSKLITLKQGKIVSFKTLLTGEMVAALAGHTILQASVDLTEALSPEYLLKGYELAVKEGLNAALFKVRVLDTIKQKEKSAIYSFFLGAVLSGEISAICQNESKKVMLSGQKQLCQAMCLLLEKVSDKEIVHVPEETAAHANVRGMVLVYENK